MTFPIIILLCFFFCFVFFKGHCHSVLTDLGKTVTDMKSAYIIVVAIVIILIIFQSFSFFFFFSTLRQLKETLEKSFSTDLSPQRGVKS